MHHTPCTVSVFCCCFLHHHHLGSLSFQHDNICSNHRAAEVKCADVSEEVAEDGSGFYVFEATLFAMACYWRFKLEENDKSLALY